MTQNRSRRLLNHVTPATLAAMLLGTVSFQPQAQSVVGQVDQVSEAITNLTNNVNLIGGLVVIVGALVVLLFIDRWRSSNALVRAEKKRDEDAAKYHTAVDKFTKIATADQYNKYYYNGFLKSLVAEIKADRAVRKQEHIDLREDMDGFKTAQKASIEAFGGRITREIANGLNAFGTLHRSTMLEVAEIARKTQLELAAKQAEDEQRIVKATIVTLQSMNILPTPVLDPAKPSTGNLPPVAESHDLDQSQGEPS
jgi:hypothetical protein